MGLGPLEIAGVIAAVVALGLVVRWWLWNR
jgi:hypothetical protein